jgi:hypothetical protein
MAWNLHRLGLLFDQQEWRKRAEIMVETVKDAAVKYPTSNGANVATVFGRYRLFVEL